MSELQNLGNERRREEHLVIQAIDHQFYLSLPFIDY
jgi:hypothetical protein